MSLGQKQEEGCENHVFISRFSLAHPSHHCIFHSAMWDINTGHALTVTLLTASILQAVYSALCFIQQYVGFSLEKLRGCYYYLLCFKYE